MLAWLISKIVRLQILYPRGLPLWAALWHLLWACNDAVHALAHAVANALPRRVAYWATIRLGSAAITGEYRMTNAEDLTVMQALERWGKD